MNLDGKDKITPTPFDAHEQVVRKPHTHDPEHGYQPVEEHVKVLAEDVTEEVAEDEPWERPRVRRPATSR